MCSLLQVQELACAVGFCAFALGGVFSSLGPLIAHTLLGVNSQLLLGSVVSVLFIANSTAQSGMSGVKLTTSLRVGTVLIAIGLALVALASHSGGLGLFLIGTVLAGAGQGITISAATAVVSELGDARGRGQTSAVFFIICYIGTAALALSTGAVATQTSLSTALVVFCLLIAIFMAVLTTSQSHRWAHERTRTASQSIDTVQE